MSTPGPDDPTAPSQPPFELGGLDPKDLLNAGLETVPPVTLPPRLVDSDATVAVSRPQPTQPRNDAPELPLPEELTNLLPHGNYVVESFLGQGGMGAVYKGLQIRLKRPVAIKIMRRDLGKDHDFEARFEREAQAMAKLNHPNIVSVIDFGEAGPDYLYIVMELIDGADLMDVIRGGQMTQEMALSLLPQICDALQFAHDHGIVHRDIKPSNIMLTRDGRIKMADFGLAKRFDVESSFRTQTGTGMGTPDYAAPEQFSPDTPIDHRADIYALGVMIYQMITGQLPRGTWKPPSQRVEVDPHWDDIVSRAMQNDPADRYQQASEVKTDVSSIPLVGSGRAAGPSAAASGPASANHPSAALGGPSALPRAKSRASLLLGLVGAAAISLGVFFIMKKPTPANSEAKASASSPASAPVSPDAQVSRAQVAASAIQWQKAGWTAEDLRNKTLVADGEWARIGQKAGAENGWRIGANGQTVAFKDGVVRLRYRWDGEAISLKTRNENTFGQVLLRGPHVELGIYLNSAKTRLFQKVALPRPLKVGDEGTLEIAAIGNRLYARLNDSIVLSSPEIPELAPGGYCSIQSENASFRDVEYAILDGIDDPLKALGWEMPNAIETALASVGPAVRPYVAYPERLKVPVPDWLRLASAEGGPLAIHTIGDPGPAKAALDLGEAARFDDFVFVASPTTGWIAVRRNGELWARNADYTGQIKTVGPIQIRSLNTGRTCYWLEEDGTGGCLYGIHHHRRPLALWKNGQVTDASLHSAAIFYPQGTGEGYHLAFDSAGILLASLPEKFPPGLVRPPADWFRGAPAPCAGDGLAALTDDGRVRTWDFTTGRSFPGMDELRRVAQLAYGSHTPNLGVMLSEAGQATVFGPKGGNVPENAIPPATAGPFIRVSPGPIFAAQKTDGSWIGWNSGEPDLAAAVAGLGPVISIASGRVIFNQGIHAEKPVMVPYLIYIQPKKTSDLDVSNTTPATTAPANPGTPLVKPLTWLPAVHSDGNAAKYHSETPDGWITGTPDNPGGIKVTHPAGPLGNFAVRLRYRWNKDARHLQVRVREPGRGVAGAVLFNDHWAITKYDVNSPPETRTQSLTTRKRTAKLEPGFEGMLEVAVIGDRVIARFDNTTLLDATVTGMATRGVAHISSAGLSFRDVEMASLEGIADPLKALGWEEPLNWQQATWSASEVAQKKIVVEDGWARIGQAAGALEKTWKLAVNGTPVSLGDGAVRLRYRYEGRALTLKIRNYTTYGYVTLWPSRLDLGIWSTAYAEREKRVQTRALATPLKDGEEGVLELAAAGRRLFARLNGSIVLTSDELSDLGLTGGCEIQSDGVSFRDVEYASLHLLGGIFDPLKVLGWERVKDDSARESGTHRNSVTRTSIQWQEMAPDVSITRNTHLAKNGEWYRIVSPGGSFELLRDESAPSFKNVAVRYRIRLLEDQAPGLKLNLDTQNWEESGKIGPDGLLLQLNGSELVLIEGSRKHPAVFSPELNLKGTEADIEFAIINQVAYARINGQTIIVGPIQRKGYRNHMSLQFPAGAETRAEFSKVSEAILDGIADPLKALGWEVPDAIGTDGNVWSDFFADWERSPDRNEFERTSLEHGPVGWQAARDGSGANAYLVDSQGRDLALRVSAKFDLLRNPQDSDQITVRLRRTPGGLPNEYNEYAIYLFRSGQAYLRVIDDKGSRKLITAQLPSGFDPHQLHTLEISTNGRLISFLVDGQEMGTAEDETLPPGGRFGINGSQSVVFEKAEYRFLDEIANPSSATKESPFVNTLGMKFVPVPGTQVLFSVWDTRVQDYEAYAKAQEAAGKKVDGSWKTQEKDGVPVGREADHPVVGVKWDDAQAFCQWLTEKDTAEGKLPQGQRYRLPTDTEWSAAVGLPPESGATPREKSGKNDVDFPWGKEWPPPKKVGNYADKTFHAKFPPKNTEGDSKMNSEQWSEGYTDGYATTSPVGSFQANAYGLYDMSGNVWQWCEDWYDKDQKDRVLRGASWYGSDRNSLRSSYRRYAPPASIRYSFNHGFRCVLELAPSAAASSAEPWENLLSDPAKLKFTGQVERTSDGLLLSEQSSAYSATGNRTQRDGAVRLRTTYGTLKAQARVRNSPAGVYVLFAQDENVVSLALHGSPERKNITVSNFRPKKPFVPDQEYELELRVKGEKLIAKLDGEVLGTAIDGNLTQGDFGVATGGTGPGVLVKSLKFLDLDKPVSSSVSTATKGAPFINTLGMKFVPVPIGSGPHKGQTVLFSVWVTRVKDYAAFAKAQEAAGMKVNTTWMRTEQDGVPVGREPDHPVVSLSWDDAQAFCQWLTEKETASGKLTPGQRYRLPTDEEWSWAAGLPQEQGSTPHEKNRKNNVDYPWGKEWPPPAKVGNYADEAFHAKFPPRKDDKDSQMLNGWTEGYTDGFATTSPVGSFPANAFGLYDMGGNVWQWCEDWYDESKGEAVRRGASWRYFHRRDLYSATRSSSSTTVHISDIGFRCVLETDLSGAAAVSPSPSLTVSSSPSSATKDSPFTNSLGMKFVPVPITGGPTDGQRVLFSIWETRVRDYDVFAKDTKRGSKKAEFEQGPTHPAVNGSWEDAVAFCVWLTERERKAGKLGTHEHYRLPTDHEWSCSVGIGDKEDAARSPGEKDQKILDVFPWGVEWPPPSRAGNLAGEELKPSLVLGRFQNIKGVIDGFRDDFINTAAAGAFPANTYGLHDLSGNVWEWCEDRHDKGQTDHVLRGGSWNNRERGHLLSSYRYRSSDGSNNYGFRCVLAAVPTMAAAPMAPVPPKAPASAVASPASATKEAPFVNTLGIEPPPTPGLRLEGSRWVEKGNS